MKTPTFLLKPSAYKTNKLYAIIPSDGNGDATVSGYVGNGTRQDEYGIIETVATDTPRLDYKQGIPGVLLEPTRKNFLAGSDGDSLTAVSSTLTTSAAITPTGNKKGAKCLDASDSVAGYAYYVGGALDNITARHTASVFVKFGDTDTISIGIESGTFARYLILDLDRDGNLTTNTNLTHTLLTLSSGTQVFVEKHVFGWFRVGFSWTMSTDANANLRVYPCGYTDVSQQGFCYIGEGMMEEGTCMSSFIPSVASATTTRNTDTLSVGASAFLPSSLDIVGVTTGAVLIHFTVESPPVVGASSTTPFFTWGGTNGRISLRRSSGTMVLARVENKDATEEDVTMGVETATSTHKVLFNIADTNVDVWVDGTKSASTAKDFAFAGNNPSFAGAGQASWIHEFTCWRDELTDAEALKVTS